MIDPVIFSFKLIYWTITLRWYGVLVMLGAVAGAWWAEREIRRRGENGEVIWDAMVWVLPIGIIGARLWYVVNNILSGSTYYTDNPAKIINIPEGGLHFFGGLLFGVITLYFFLKRNGLDTWLFLDALAPATLLGQAIARPANFINQELYGQPTQLPWGIQILGEHRLPQYSDLTQFPVDTTRFHPTFAYEMILNILIVLFLWWLSRRYEEEMKPGALFSAWLLLAGLSRTFIEFFRPDQTLIGNTFITYTMLVSFLMAVVGLIMLLVRYGKLQFALAENWEEEYQVKKAAKQEAAAITRPAAPSVETPVSLNKKVSRKKSANVVLLTKDKKKVATKKAAKKTSTKKTSASGTAAKKTTVAAKRKSYS
ncbi:MAG: prolipoprotein diacylglyceryl transferase [Anaerolineales bacterium]|nr:prolipoprotein diacylglyceryl transferase [Anaerolineales bacterium]